jgi:hypothetical protein
MYTLSWAGRSVSFLSALGEMLSGRRVAVMQNLLSESPQNVDLPF